jgi:hypothetical protein
MGRSLAAVLVSILPAGVLSCPPTPPTAIPPCASRSSGGPDKVSNMQWQRVGEAKKKDKLEAAEYRGKRKART